MSDFPQRRRLEQLLSLVIDGESTPADHAALTALLRESAVAREYFVDYMQHHAIMTWEHTRPAVFDPSCKQPAPQPADADADADELLDDSSILWEAIEQERAARIKREAAAALQREREAEEEKRRRESWARLNGSTTPYCAPTPSRPNSCCFIGVSAPMATWASCRPDWVTKLVETRSLA